MKRTCYQLEEDGRITPVSCQNIFTQAAQGGGAFWMEIESAGSAELSAMLTALDLHPLLIEDCIEPGYSTMIDKYETTVYIEFPVNRPQPYDHAAYLSVIGMPNLLITIRRGNLPGIDEIARGLQGRHRLYNNRPPLLLYRIFDHFINQNIMAVRHLREQVDALTRLFVEKAEEVDPEMIAALRRRVGSQSDINEDQFYCLKSLAGLQVPGVNLDEDRPYFYDLISNAEYAVRSMVRLEERLSDLHSDYQMMTHEATEKRLRILTVLSAILLPLTLITGIYGMNFDRMPLLHWRYGHALITVTMLIILGGMLLYFYRQGWLD